MADEQVLLKAYPSMFRGRPFAFVLCCLLALVAGLGLVILIVWWLKCRATELTVTDRRTTLRTGLLSKHTTEVRHQDVRSIDVIQGIFQRLLGTGGIAIGSAGTAGIEISVTGLPAPQRIADLIRQHQA